MAVKRLNAVVCETSYGASIEDANRRHRRGERQAQCRDCLRWYWPGQEHDHEAVS